LKPTNYPKLYQTRRVVACYDKGGQFQDKTFKIPARFPMTVRTPEVASSTKMYHHRLPL